jgi:uncharacterized membrane protein YgdD (TMEM256/DUF423 family)
VTARAFAAFGALCCAAAIALSAWALHGVDGHARVQPAIAAAIAFGHGLALVAIAARASLPATLARAGFALGIALFAGSLVGAVAFGWPTAAAPAGGMVLMAAWAILAVDFLRQR